MALCIDGVTCDNDHMGEFLSDMMVLVGHVGLFHTERSLHTQRSVSYFIQMFTIPSL